MVDLMVNMTPEIKFGENYFFGFPWSPLWTKSRSFLRETFSQNFLEQPPFLTGMLLDYFLMLNNVVYSDFGYSAIKSHNWKTYPRIRRTPRIRRVLYA